MAEKTKCMMLQLLPKFQELRDARSYMEPQVKQILYAFARDLERKRKMKPWRADRLRQFIETVFNFDIEEK